MRMGVPEEQAIEKDSYIGKLSNNIFSNPNTSAKLKAVLLQEIFKGI